MARLPLTHVRRLPLSAIARYWAQETDSSEDMLLQELRLGCLNIPRIEKGENIIDEIVEEDSLPSALVPVDKEWLTKFCEKQGWDRPRFWFPEDAIANPVGRPGHMARSIEKFLERHAAGVIATSISAEAREIHNTLVRETDGGHVSQPKTIQNHIRDAWYGQRAIGFDENGS